MPLEAKAARKTIKSLADQYGLSGFCRPGKPGFVVVQGPDANVRRMERDMRDQLSTCTRNMGCWGPANHHFQSISVVAKRDAKNTTTAAPILFVETETETVLHLAHIMEARGWLDLFWEGARMDSTSYDVIPDNPGKADPYLKPRGGTKRKKGNQKVR